MFFFSRRRGFLVLGLATWLSYPLLAFLALHTHRLLRSLPGPGVGVRALAPHREAPAVPDALVGVDLDLALDVLGHVASEVAFDLVVPVDPVADGDDLGVGEVADLAAPVHVDPLHRLAGPGGADAVDVAKGDVHPLLAGKVDACDPCHVPVCPPTPGAACAGGPSSRSP